ncbi:hypothetical protein [Acutalibacter sp.]|jgi:hypothetical protein|uniref:hypothetical protein n=1 Tax=Acutalibacter sp. TaxID=1918636 RepID=UPI00216D36BA|nr:hypothetical protein [Acutalibacter sp.]
MKWKVPVTWEMYGTIFVEADSAGEAIEKAKDYEGELPTENYYVDDSWRPSCDDIELPLYQDKN